MIIVNRIGERLTVSCRDKEFSMQYSEEKLKALQKIEKNSQEVKTMDELTILLELVEGLSKEDIKERIESFHPEIFFNSPTNQYYVKLKDKVADKPLPVEFVDKLQISLEKGVSIDPLIKCWKRFLRNPISKNEETVELFIGYLDMLYLDRAKEAELMEEGYGEPMAVKKALTTEVKITQEGLIACFKTSNELLTKFELDKDGNKVEVERYKTTKTLDPDTGEFTIEGGNPDEVPAEDRVFYPYMKGLDGGTPWLCDGPNGYGDKPVHFYKIGCVHTLAEGDYDVSNNMTASFYTGGLSYVEAWNGADIHTCLVDPMDITGFIDSYSNGHNALKTRRFYIDGSLKAINHSIYHSSAYATMGDLEWDKISDEIIKNHGELAKEATNEIDYLKQL